MASRSTGRGRPNAAGGRAAIVSPLQGFVHTEVAGGIALLAATIAAIAWANSPWSDAYHDLWRSTVAIRTGLVSIEKDVGHLVNDGLMAIFFFFVGLEIKRELLHGELASVRRAALPVAAALGGMAVPAAFYAAINAGGDGARGWGIPMATDIAFALGVLALAGPRVPFSLKVFLLALAIVDDLGAILVIALFYTETIAWEAVGWAALVLALIIGANRAGFRSVDGYVILGGLFWLAVLKSGIHATIAGVILGMLTPSRARLAADAFETGAPGLLARLKDARGQGTEATQAVLNTIESAVREVEAPLDRLQRQLHPWVSFLILPVFALANAGVDLSGEAIRDAASSPVSGGIVAGLVLGKPVGILLFAALAVRTGVAHLPADVGWRGLGGVAVLAGLGFTVSLFITELAFTSEALVAEARVGILAASIVAAAAGLAALRGGLPNPGAMRPGPASAD